MIRKKKPGKSVVKLCAKIKDELCIDASAEHFERTYAGKWQRKAGDPVWVIYLAPNYITCIGSCDPVSLCIRKDMRLVIDGNEIIAERIDK